MGSGVDKIAGSDGKGVTLNNMLTLKKILTLNPSQYIKHDLSGRGGVDKIAGRDCQVVFKAHRLCVDKKTFRAAAEVTRSRAVIAKSLKIVKPDL